MMLIHLTKPNSNYRIIVMYGMYYRILIIFLHIYWNENLAIKVFS